jgi:phage terminase large subunit
MESKTYKKLLSALKKNETVILQGGTSSGKTHAVLEFAIPLMAVEERGSVFSVVSETLPQLRRGAIRDFLQKLDEKELYFEKWHNKSNNSYTFPGHGTIEFFGADDTDASKGPRRDYAFLNEANRIKWTVADQLMIRTKKRTFIDFNPSVRFWAHEYAEANRDTTELFISTYLDNCFLDEKIIRKIEAKKPKYNEHGILISGSPNWWKVYGEGQIGSHEGVIFKEGEHWQFCDDFVPDLQTADCFGLDFGFASDESALEGIWRYEQGFYAKCLMYETGMNEKNYIEKFEKISIPKNAKIYADSASPMLIEAIRKAGWYNVEATKKYSGSVLDGINSVQNQMLYFSPEDLINKEEVLGYEWKPNKMLADKFSETPTGTDHAMDAIRYAIFGFMGRVEHGKYERPKTIGSEGLITSGIRSKTF